MATSFTKTVSARISQHSMTSIEWSQKNPILLPGEMGFETDTGRIKICDQSTIDSTNGGKAWNDIPYTRVPVLTDFNDAQNKNSTVMPLSAKLGSDLLNRIENGPIYWKAIHANAPTHNFPSDYNNVAGWNLKDDGGVNKDSYSSEWEYYGASDVAPINSPHFTGAPTAPDPSGAEDGKGRDGSTSIANTKYVVDTVKSFLEASSAMIFKGTIGPDANCTIHELPSDYSTGDTYICSGTGGTYAGNVCEPGDMLICIKDSDVESNPADAWTVVQVNLNGAVTGPASARIGDLAVFADTTGKVIKDSNINVDDVLTQDDFIQITCEFEPTN